MSICVKVYIPLEQVGIVIGKKGGTVHHLKTETDTEIRLLPKQPESAWQPISIQGDISNIKMAYSMIASLVDEIDDVILEFNLFRADCLKLHTMKSVPRVSASTKVRILVPFHDSKDMPLVVLEGVFESVCEAYQLLLEETAANNGHIVPASKDTVEVGGKGPVKTTVARANQSVSDPQGPEKGSEAKAKKERPAALVTAADKSANWRLSKPDQQPENGGVLLERSDEPASAASSSEGISRIDGGRGRGLRGGRGIKSVKGGRENRGAGRGRGPRSTPSAGGEFMSSTASLQENISVNTD